MLPPPVLGGAVTRVIIAVRAVEVDGIGKAETGAPPVIADTVAQRADRCR